MDLPVAETFTHGSTWLTQHMQVSNLLHGGSALDIFRSLSRLKCSCLHCHCRQVLFFPSLAQQLCSWIGLIVGLPECRKRIANEHRIDNKKKTSEKKQQRRAKIEW